MQIPYCIDYLFYNHFSLLFGNFLMLFQVIWKIWSLTVFKYSTERVIVDFYSIIKFHNIWMEKSFVDCILSQSMLYVILFCAAVPVWMKLMYFTCNLPHFFNIKSFINFTKTSFSQKPQKLIFLYFDPIWYTRLWVDFSIFWVLLLKK